MVVALSASAAPVNIGLGVLDWIVIVGYGLGMLAIGWYYSRRTATTDDYLLGGRNMKPMGVGLSLFASLFSSVTYLIYPGELIKYGPMLALGHVVAMPLIAGVVGWFLIPFIMKYKITSAYQILELRLGRAVSIVGSVMFLSLRLLWMAVVIYAITDKVLIPLTSLDLKAAPYVAAVLGLVTLVYTSMGGLRAVVLTDVVQFFILLLGAILTLVLISVYLGGVSNWWPTQWPEHWPKPEWGYSPTARISFVGVIIATFTWYVCTCGSDQIAIQRYLATRDARSARSTLIWALLGSTMACIFLTVVGLAQLAYFSANPQLFPSGQTIHGDSDQLFSRFIACGVPTGLSGLMVAALLAAAMSSLSSGINSASSVITVDFIDRFRKDKQTEINHVRTARYISVFVGLAVVMLSCCVGMIKGNLLEIAYKVVNLLVAPLFGLFFMAMFVRWATGFGTLIGAAFGLAVVGTINFWEEMTGAKGISFLWAMPLGLLVQATVGMVASLLPIGRKSTRRLIRSETDR